MEVGLIAIVTMKKSLQRDESWENPIVNNLFKFGITKALHSQHVIITSTGKFYAGVLHLFKRTTAKKTA